MIYIAADHAGFELKAEIVKYLRSKNIVVEDLGAKRYDQDDDYPDFAALLAKKVEYRDNLGILVCASGQGMCITANKFKGVRATQAWSVPSAKAARSDDDANVLCLAGKLENIDSPIDIVKTFLETEFKNEEKYLRRINKLEL